MYPSKLNVAEKPVWYYSDCFPPDRPYRLTSTFCHQNYQIDMHRHDFYEVNFIVRGRGVHYTERSHREIGVGDIIVVPPSAFHGYYEIDGLDVFHMLIHKNFFHRYYSDLNMLTAFQILFNADHMVRENNRDLPLFHVDGDAYAQLHELFVKLADLEQTTSTEDHLTAYALSLMIVIRLCAEYRRQFLGNSDEANKNDGQDLSILKAVDYIHTHYAEKISLDELTKLTYMSKATLCERFRRLMGFTPANYINYYRILVAKKMLIETTRSVTEIAQDAGFFDTSHFIRTYKKYEGISPSLLRASLPGNRIDESHRESGA